ncbi:sensor histidine kinase [Fibrisoma limi]|nr:sensor histidine kinase [Fibrisoma limi]
MNRSISRYFRSGYCRRWFLVVLPTLITSFVFGQHPLGQYPLGQHPLGQQSLRFEHLGTDQGLSHNRIFCVYQDRQGFMWFGTGDGLNRYDGYTFTVYKPDPSDPNNHMAHNTVWDMVESQSGEIWFVTPGGGLHRLNRQTGRINFFRVERDGSDRFAPYDICYTMIEDKQGIFWIGSEGGLARFDPRTKQYRLYDIPVAQGADDRVWAIQEDRFGTLWIGTSNGLFTMNRQTEKFTPFYFGPEPTGKQPRVESMYLGSDNSLWIGTKYQGLHRLRPSKGPTPSRSRAATTYMPTGQVYLMNLEILPKGLGEDERHQLMVGTRDGLFQLNPETGEYINYQEDPSVAGALSHNVVWALRADNQGTFWIGTSNGIDRYSMLTPRFAFYQPIPDHNATPRSTNNVTMLSADGQGNIWFCNPIQSYIKGVFRLNLSSHRTYLNNTSKPLTPDVFTPERVVAQSPADVISNLHCDRSGRIWMATPSGLHTIDAKGQSLHYPAGFPITSIDEDEEGKLWVGGQSNLAQFDPIDGRFTLYRIDKDKPIGKGGGQVNDILISRSGDVWVSVGGLGPCKLNRRTGRFKCYHPHYGTSQKVFYGRDVTALSETPDGAIWASTNIGGLFRIDPMSGAVSTFTIHDGLPDNHVVALVTDQQGMLWMATGKELCRLDPVTRTLRVFDEQDGLLSQIFSGACTRTPTGELAFGSTNGFVVFRPSEIITNGYKPAVYITQVQVLDSARLFPSSPLKLNYHDNVISFNFVGLNYIAPKKNQYAYQLEGVNNKWVYCGTQRSATYSFLAPGNYVFRVKASNNDGIWNEKGAAIRLVILPPWWLTGWAYILYTGLVALGVWGLVRYRSRQLLRANQLLEQKVALRTEEVIQQKQEIEIQRNHLADALANLKTTQAQLVQKEKLASLGELTAGIAHEIQNPLNFVNNYAELSTDLVDELSGEALAGRNEHVLDIANSLKSNLRKINHHGSRASNIVLGMLEHSRADSGEKRPIDLNALADEYLKIAYYGMRTKDKTGSPGEPNRFNCKLVADFDPTLERVDVVPQELGRVLLNLYNNAFYAVAQRAKAQSEGYQPTVRVSTRRLMSALEIRVLDNGTGIPESVKAKIFQPFFTTKPTGEGTGLGLSLSYDIVTKGHGGTLTVESTEGKGTEFRIVLPLTR